MEKPNRQSGSQDPKSTPASEPSHGSSRGKDIGRMPNRPHLAQMMLIADQSTVMQRRKKEFHSAQGTDIEDGVVQRQYAANVSLKPPEEAKAFKPNQLFISNIVLPSGVNERPETSIEGANEGAHTISWTIQKGSFTSMPRKRLDQFINDYLKPDWNHLQAQKKWLKTTKPAVALKFGWLNSYLNKYNDGFFTNLLDTNTSAVAIKKQVQEALSDLFIASQLSPITTHYHLKKKEFRPSYHGEGQAKINLKQWDEANSPQQNNPGLNTVMPQVEKFFDLGKDEKAFEGKDAVVLMIDQLMRYFKRLYPNLARKYQAGLRDAFIVKYANPLNKTPNYQKQGLEVPLPQPPKKQLFSAMFKLDYGAAKANQTKYTADMLIVDQVRVSMARPNSKYPSAQKSHTIAWTLALQSLEKMGKGKTIRNYLLDMKYRWELLNEQDWAWMMQRPGIGKDLPNNKYRLKILSEKIEPTIAKIDRLIKTGMMTDLSWSFEIQNLIGDYMPVFQASPLTTLKDGRPINKGEQFANKSLIPKEDALQEFQDKKAESNEDEMKLDEPQAMGAGGFKTMIYKYIDLNLVSLPKNVERAASVSTIFQSLEVMVEQAFPQHWELHRKEVQKLILKRLDVYKDKKDYRKYVGDHHYHQGMRSIQQGDLRNDGVAKYNSAKDDYNLGLQHIGNQNFAKRKDAESKELDAHDQAIDDYNEGIRLAIAQIPNLKGVPQITLKAWAECSVAIELAMIQEDEESMFAMASTRADQKGVEEIKKALDIFKVAPNINAIPAEGNNGTYRMVLSAFLKGYNEAKASPDINPKPGHQTLPEKIAFDQYQAGFASAYFSPALNPAPPLIGVKKEAYLAFKQGYDLAFQNPQAQPQNLSPAAVKGFSGYKTGVYVAKSAPNANEPFGVSPAELRGWQHYMAGYQSVTKAIPIPNYLHVSGAAILGTNDAKAAKK